MNNRICILLLTIMSAFYSFADNKVIIRNIDTEESVEVSVPDGLKISIQEYNSNWLDSIPYLVEHARWKEPWAYEALAECYRYGKGGVEKSMFNAIMSYEEAGRSATEIAEAAYESNPTDEFGLLNHLMEGLDKRRISEEDVIRMIDEPATPKFSWIVSLRDILRQKTDERKEFIYSRLTPDSRSDEFLIGFACLAIDDDQIFDKTFVNISDDYMRKVRLFGEKLPFIYDVIAEKMWRRYDENREDRGKYLSAALECMSNADQAGFLSKHNMTRVLTFCEENGIDERIPFSDEDLARFDAICSKEYRDHINSTVAVEEGEVEMDECPVELIEE